MVKFSIMQEPTVDECQKRWIGGKETGKKCANRKERDDSYKSYQNKGASVILGFSS